MNKKMNKKMKMVSLQVSESVFEILSTMARESQGSISREIRVAISQYILNHPSKVLKHTFEETKKE